MKFAIVIPDGCADEPQESLGGRTPLEAARTPAMDALATMGAVGCANHTPRAFIPGSDIANLSLFGYDPHRYFTGRAPLEAAAMGIHLGPDDWAIRCNVVTIQDQVMRDFTAGHVSNDEARALLATAQERLREVAGALTDRLEFVPGVSYRNLLLYRGIPGQNELFTRDTRSTPPHDLTDRSVSEDFPRGPGSSLLAEIMSRSVDWFRDHEVNRARVARGSLPATNVWLWGLGQAPQLPAFEARHSVQGAMISAVDLLRGLARIVGWVCIDVPGATGYIDTDYAAKGRAAVAALERYDLVCVHVEAPDEASHQGDVAEKIRALEQIDTCIVAPLVERLRAFAEWRMLVTPDHPTPLRTKTHSHGDVPFVIAGSDVEQDDAQEYSERAASRSPWSVPHGWELMSSFIGNTRAGRTTEASVLATHHHGEK